jgi:hypothetical protein
MIGESVNEENVLNTPNSATEYSVILPPGTVLSCQSVHWNPATGSVED